MPFTNQRVSIRDVSPRVEDGRFPARTSRGEPTRIEADVYADSHDLVAAVARWRQVGAQGWHEAAMRLVVNDRYRATIVPPELGRIEFEVQAWIDRFASWQRDLRKKADAGVVTELDLAMGAEVVRDAADAADGDDAESLRTAADRLVGDDEVFLRVEAGLSDDLRALVRANDPRRHATTTDQTLRMRVDRPKARFSSWYELFPRSTGPSGEHGTLRDVIDRLDYVASMGFDVLYLPPIHPIGRSHRKGRNNVVDAAEDDVGSPWAIGSEEGGHTAIHPRLGTLDDLHALIAACRERGLELALDIAFQCAPDHPWVTEHPEWFRHRPDGTIQYAENPPKKYQDIYPLDFETEDVEGLWTALKGVFDYWIEQGVTIFRVDNPHTKSFPFWGWVIDELTRDHPECVFLSEAFTRPKVMYELAKQGFTQSYTYFAWRQAKWEIEQYYTELYSRPVVDFFRSNAWPNTPDILTEQLQYGGRPAFVQRLVLAATLSANYGIYGPPFELMEHVARPGAEEYLDNEKYEIRDWDLDASHSLRELIARVNRIRHTHPALQHDRTLTFHEIKNEALIAYSKTAPDGGDVILTIVNLDTNWTQSATTWLDLPAMGLEPGASFVVHDLLGGARFRWEGEENYVELDPHVTPAHIFHVSPLEHRTERDFDTF